MDAKARDMMPPCMEAERQGGEKEEGHVNTSKLEFKDE